jgi:methylthioribulose-1-phosphate dehydratase
MSSQLENPVQLGPTASEGERESAQAALMDVGAYFHSRGWSLATSSNYSVVLSRDPLRLLITASGKDKGRLKRTDFVVVDETGRAVAPADQRPSAETLLHVALAEQPGVGAVLHTHSVWGTLVSDWRRVAGFVRIADYEMLKGLEGIRTHEHVLDLPIFDNTQDIAALAAQVEERLADQVHPLQYGFLIHRHGLYTWGRDLDEARRHVEVFEFLFEVVGRSTEPPRRQERQEAILIRDQGAQ